MNAIHSTNFTHLCHNLDTASQLELRVSSIALALLPLSECVRQRCRAARALVELLAGLTEEQQDVFYDTYFGTSVQQWPLRAEHATAQSCPVGLPAASLTSSDQTGLQEVFKQVYNNGPLAASAISLSKPRAGNLDLLVLQCLSISYVKNTDEAAFEYYIRVSRNSVAPFELAWAGEETGLIHALRPVGGVFRCRGPGGRYYNGSLLQELATAVRPLCLPSNCPDPLEFLLHGLLTQFLDGWQVPSRSHVGLNNESCMLRMRALRQLPRYFRGSPLQPVEELNPNTCDAEIWRSIAKAQSLERNAAWKNRECLHRKRRNDKWALEVGELLDPAGITAKAEQARFSYLTAGYFQTRRQLVSKAHVFSDSASVWHRSGTAAHGDGMVSGDILLYTWEPRQAPPLPDLVINNLLFSTESPSPRTARLLISGAMYEFTGCTDEESKLSIHLVLEFDSSESEEDAELAEEASWQSLLFDLNGYHGDRRLLNWPLLKWLRTALPGCDHLPDMQILDCIVAVALHLPPPMTFDISHTSHTCQAAALQKHSEEELVGMANSLTKQLGLVEDHKQEYGEGPWQRPKNSVHLEVLKTPGSHMLDCFRQHLYEQGLKAVNEWHLGDYVHEREGTFEEDELECAGVHFPTGLEFQENQPPTPWLHPVLDEKALLHQIHLLGQKIEVGATHNILGLLDCARDRKKRFQDASGFQIKGCLVFPQWHPAHNDGEDESSESEPEDEWYEGPQGSIQPCAFGAASSNEIDPVPRRALRIRYPLSAQLNAILRASESQTSTGSSFRN